MGKSHSSAVRGGQVPAALPTFCLRDVLHMRSNVVLPISRSDAEFLIKVKDERQGSHG